MAYYTLNCAIIQEMKNKGRKTQKGVFLDYASITPVDITVAAEMARVQQNFWANPSSLHRFGEEAKEALREARFKIAQILHCRANEIFFTSGGTESLNLAILGVVQSALKSNVLPHVITSSIEHPAVLEPIKFLLQEKKIEVSFLNPNEKGIVSPESVKRELKPNTVLVAIQHANNEIGVIQPVSKISKIIKNFGGSKPYLLVDASQSVLYEDVSIERLKADLLVLDGIKMYGPRGVGILVVRHGVDIAPVVFGGGQENGLRSGTENVVGACGLAKALEIATKIREKESKRLTRLRDYTISKIMKEIPHTSLNGDLESRLPNNINVCFDLPSFSAGVHQDRLDSEFLVIRLDVLGFAVSAASACHSLNLENGSYVVESLGKPECKSSSLRVTLGRGTTKADLDKLVSALKSIVK